MRATFLLALMAAVGMQAQDNRPLVGARRSFSSPPAGSTLDLHVCAPGEQADVYLGDWCGTLKPPPPAPFDVPPKVINKWTPPLPENWDGHETYENLSCKLQGAYDTTDKMCIDGKVYKSTISRTCEDKSRFLLMSEDNKWHCLNLGAKP